MQLGLSSAAILYLSGYSVRHVRVGQTLNPLDGGSRTERLASALSHQVKGRSPEAETYSGEVHSQRTTLIDTNHELPKQTNNNRKKMGQYTVRCITLIIT